jgi:hypothetical protein
MEIIRMSDREKSGINKTMLEGEAGLFPCTEEVYPDATVKISRDQYSIFEIRRMLKDTKDLIIAPEFQRNAVWKIEQLNMISLTESTGGAPG